MSEMIHQRRNAEKKEERYDLFSSLLDASEEESDGQAKLTDRELFGSRPRCLSLYTYLALNFALQATSSSSFWRVSWKKALRRSAH